MRLRLVVSTLAVLSHPAADDATAQQVELQDGEAVVVESVGPAAVLFGEGPDMLSMPSRVRVSKLRWYMVQDSTLGVVFRKPSGVKLGSNGCFDGDVDLRRLSGRPIGVEVRAVTFNYWNEVTGVFRVSELRAEGQPDSFDLNPDWSESGDTEREHRTSVMWVHRVWDVESGEIVEADLAPVLSAVRLLGHEAVTLADLTEVTNATTSPGAVGDLFLGYRWGERGGCKG